MATLTTILPGILLLIAILSAGVVYGTDAFFAVVGRRALARSGEPGIADVMGHLHETGDARMPIFGALGLLATLAYTVAMFARSGWAAAAGWLGLAAWLALVAHLALYLVWSKPVNVELTAAARDGRVPADTRALQQRWDRVIGARAVLLTLAVGCLVLAALAQ